MARTKAPKAATRAPAARSARRPRTFDLCPSGFSSSSGPDGEVPSRSTTENYHRKYCHKRAKWKNLGAKPRRDPGARCSGERSNQDAVMTFWKPSAREKQLGLDYITDRCIYL
jgi:hypothetical protein